MSRLDPTLGAPAGALAVLIVGAGFSGIAMALACRRAGIGPILVIDRGAGVGGTWRDNTYPGAACDVPSHLYCLSLAPKADWSRLYARQPEIEAYLRGVVADHGLGPLIRPRTALTAAAWDEAAGLWRAETSAGELRARALVSAMGGLHHPALPDIPGRESFAGPAFHTARWDHGVDLTGLRVGVIGTGASAVQVVPELARVAGRLTLFQRTPPWVLPKRDRPIAAAVQARYRRLPLARRLERARLFWLHEASAFLGFTRVSRLTAQAEAVARRHLARAVPDEALRARLTPAYRLGCKRVLLSDAYYPALARANVRLETGAIARITPEGVETAGGETVGVGGTVRHALDALVYATGFDVAGAFARVEVAGRGGLRLADAWRDGIAAHHGVTVAGFPNHFLLLGPNTGLGHNSVLEMVEAQVGHVLDCLGALGRGARSIAVRPEAQAASVARVRARLADSVWQAGGCRSWYQDAGGRNVALWPDSVLAYRRRAGRARMGDYQVG